LGSPDKHAPGVVRPGEETAEAVSVEDGGKPADADGGRVVFGTDEITLKGEGKPVEGRYELNPTKKPKCIDVAVDGKKLLGIYQLHGDKLKLCLNEDPGGERPTEFVSTGGRSPNDLLIVLECEKP
jgi:uncharacterized protein (TIGR03067 family)